MTTATLSRPALTPQILDLYQALQREARALVDAMSDLIDRAELLDNDTALTVDDNDAMFAALRDLTGSTALWDIFAEVGIPR